MPPPDAPTGTFTLRRRGGLLPPLALVRKRVGSDLRGATLVGPLPLPFTIEPAGEGYRLRYRFPLSLLQDELHPRVDGGFDGVARIAGIRYGSFDMRPDATPR